jgi:hypothetical protein
MGSMLTWNSTLETYHQDDIVNMEQLVHHPKTFLIDSPLGLRTWCPH